MNLALAQQSLAGLADKKAIIAAWKKGIPVDGTHIQRKRRVIYALTVTAIHDFKDSLLT